MTTGQWNDPQNQLKLESTNKKPYRWPLSVVLLWSCLVCSSFQFSFNLAIAPKDRSFGRCAFFCWSVLFWLFLGCDFLFVHVRSFCKKRVHIPGEHGVKIYVMVFHRPIEFENENWFDVLINTISSKFIMGKTSQSRCCKIVKNER